VSALDLYGRWFGPYPYNELDIIAAPLAGALGVSWAGIIYLDGPGMLGVLAPNDPVRFASIVAHEVGHQWWGSLVGFNSNDHTFLLEGLTNYVSILWIGATSGRDAAIAAMQSSLATPYVALLEASGDQIADLPIADGQSGRSTIFYAKSSLGFFAINETIGDDAFRTALMELSRDFGFDIAEPADVLARLEATSGQDLSDLWRFWFEAAETTPADVEALFA
jgi:aminopeptidase N